MVPKIIAVYVAAVALGLCGCYPEVHVVDLVATGPSWQPVYASPAELSGLRVSAGPAPGWRFPSTLSRGGEGVVAVREDVLARVDSLRGFYLGASDEPGARFFPMTAYVEAAGARAITVVNDTTLRLERLSGTTLVNVADAAAPLVLDGTEEADADFPDPTVPPPPDAVDADAGAFGVVSPDGGSSRYFLCPDEHRPATGERFLGWRIGSVTDLATLCFHPR